MCTAYCGCALHDACIDWSTPWIACCSQSLGRCMVALLCDKEGQRWASKLSLFRIPFCYDSFSKILVVDHLYKQLGIAIFPCIYDRRYNSRQKSMGQWQIFFSREVEKSLFNFQNPLTPQSNLEMLSLGRMDRNQHYMGVGRGQWRQRSFADKTLKCPKTFVAHCS